MLDVILGFIFSTWVTWLIIRLIACFDEEIGANDTFFRIIAYIIDLGMIAIMVIWLIFRFRT